ncbi:anti-sigma factor family protein [Thermospira aquatica]|uniref:Zf-HC2 domain-containing protein n=1 Tax=Thermospira aquatica TaxID=2828656 RepID=A0AAX3BF20_9SPIR|nr:zf-HC2 domain-containing protein [Thermospira aquatica]URA10674.1 zf-HC2 domain-containing protein [Thermospira aquatica]
MFCPEYELSTWLAYLDGSLDVQLSQKLEAHLDACSQCLKELLEINRIHARMSTLKPGHSPLPELRDSFILVCRQAKKTIQTLLGELIPLPALATRAPSSSSWEYHSLTLGFSLTITEKNDGFSLVVQGTLPSFVLTGDKPLFQGEVNGRLALSNLPAGNYTIETEKGRLEFTLQP